MQSITLCTLVIAVFLAISDGDANGSDVKIDYTIENTRADLGPIFSFTKHLVQGGNKAFVKFMDLAANQDSHFGYDSTDYDPPLGLFIEEINGLAGNFADQTFWAFLRRDSNGDDCLHNLGVSNYHPSTGERIVFSFQTWDIFNTVPSCDVTVDGDSNGAAVKINYTIENTNADLGPTFSFNQHLVQGGGSKPFWRFMDLAAIHDYHFEYKWIMKVWGRSIREINGLPVSVAEQKFWSFMRRDSNGVDCLHNVGVSSYYPSSGEHIVHSFQTWDIFNHVPNCVTGNFGH